MCVPRFVRIGAEGSKVPRTSSHNRRIRIVFGCSRREKNKAFVLLRGPRTGSSSEGTLPAETARPILRSE